VLAGWNHILSGKFLAPVTSKCCPVINLHPALPGAFPGANAIDRAWNAFYIDKSITETGVMVHHVIEAVDAGEVIAYERLPIQGMLSYERFTGMIHRAEKRVLLRALGALLRTA